MTDTCACCGKPTDAVEEHHVNHRKGDNHPDNLSVRDRRCHMEHHNNERAAKFAHGPGGP
jgi:transposase